MVCPATSIGEQAANRTGPGIGVCVCGDFVGRRRSCLDDQAPAQRKLDQRCGASGPVASGSSWARKTRGGNTRHEVSGLCAELRGGERAAVYGSTAGTCGLNTSFVFPDVTLAEDKERLAQFLYYKGVSFSDIDENHFESLDNERAYYLSSLIKRGRFNPRLSVDWQPITPEEVRGALAYYADFVATFNRERAAHPELSYLLVNPEEHFDLTNFDRWYERDGGERIGSYTLFRVRLRP